jgi:hypothetical protein
MEENYQINQKTIPQIVDNPISQRIAELELAIANFHTENLTSKLVEMGAIKPKILGYLN